MLGVPACMLATMSKRSVCHVSTFRCHRGPLYVQSSNLDTMGQAASNVTSNTVKDPNEAQGDLKSAVKLASNVSDASSSALPDAHQITTQEAQKTGKGANVYDESNESKSGGIAAPLSYGGLSSNNLVYKAVIPVDAVTVNGKAYEYGWALKAANLLRGSGAKYLVQEHRLFD